MTGTPKLGLYSPGGQPSDDWEGEIHRCGLRPIRVSPTDRATPGRGAGDDIDVMFVRQADVEGFREAWRRHPLAVVVLCTRCDRDVTELFPSSWSCLTGPVSRAAIDAAIWTAIHHHNRFRNAVRDLDTLAGGLTGGSQPKEA